MISCDWTMEIYAETSITKYQNVDGHDVLNAFDFLRAPVI